MTDTVIRPMTEFNAREGEKFGVLFPRMWEQPGEKCLHRQRRRGRVTLVCCRPKGHAALYVERHLHDVPPQHQKKETI